MRTQTRRPARGACAHLWVGLFLVLGGCNATSGHTMNQVGMAFYRQGNYAKARGEFQRATLDNPGNANYTHNLAAAMRKQGDLPGAEQLYRQALATDPAHQPSYHGLASLLKDQGRHPEAIELLQGWVATQPNAPGAHVEMAWMQRELGDLNGAEHSLRQALQQRPNHPVALAHLGQVYQDSGQVDRAVAMYNRSLHKRWYQPRVQSRLAAAKRLQTAQHALPPTYAPTIGAAPVFASNPPQAPQPGTAFNADPAHTSPNATNPSLARPL